MFIIACPWFLVTKDFFFERRKRDDILEGGAGDDLMFGEAGKDRFTFAGQEAFSSSNLGVDRIADFQLGDRISLSKNVFAALSTSVNSQLIANDFAVINTNSNSEISQAGSQSAVIVYNSATGSILYNENKTEDGLGDGSKFASIDGVVPLSNNSFSVIQ